MHIILLSGGSGKRLWPLSNDIRSKQFIKIFRRGDGGYESMVQRMYREILEADPDASVSIATSKSQVSAIHNQLGEQVGISVEPCRRDTFPAIALATMYLHDVQGVGEDEAVVVCPCDPYVEKDYFRALKRLSALAESGAADLCLLGMEPTYPSEKYGYILPASKAAESRVKSFREKPDEAAALPFCSLRTKRILAAGATPQSHHKNRSSTTHAPAPLLLQTSRLSQLNGTIRSIHHCRPRSVQQIPPWSLLLSVIVPVSQSA